MRSACTSTTRAPSPDHKGPAFSHVTSGRAESVPKISVACQPSAAASAAQRSRNVPIASMTARHRRSGTPAGGRSGSSRAKPSAQTRGILPSFSAIAARSASASPQLVGAVSSAATVSPGASVCGDETPRLAQRLGGCLGSAQGGPRLSSRTSHPSSRHCLAELWGVSVSRSPEAETARQVRGRAHQPSSNPCAAAFFFNRSTFDLCIPSSSAASLIDMPSRSASATRFSSASAISVRVHTAAPSRSS
jgi:hypothetical protein